MNERVYMVWGYYDGVRSGIADYDGEPHYFESKFNDVADEYDNEFELTPLDDETLEKAVEQWKIYRTWEIRFHSGKESVDTHPQNDRENSRYHELDLQIQSAIRERQPTFRTGATFHVLEEQPDLPVGCLKEMEVEWK